MEKEGDSRLESNDFVGRWERFKEKGASEWILPGWGWGGERYNIKRERERSGRREL